MGAAGAATGAGAGIPRVRGRPLRPTGPVFCGAGGAAAKLNPPTMGCCCSCWKGMAAAEGMGACAGATAMPEREAMMADCCFWSSSSWGRRAAAAVGEVAMATVRAWIWAFSATSAPAPPPGAAGAGAAGAANWGAAAAPAVAVGAGAKFPKPPAAGAPLPPAAVAAGAPEVRDIPPNMSTKGAAAAGGATATWGRNCCCCC